MRRNSLEIRSMFDALLALVTIERGLELWLSRRNARWAAERGGIEVARAQVPMMGVLQAGLILGSFFEAQRRRAPASAWAGSMMVLVGLAQGLRYWAVRSLGRRWNVRVIVIPGMPAAVAGPYRLIRHPNYVAVVLEGMALPLVHRAFLTAAAFTLANAAVLQARIRAEERALALHSNYEARFSATPRFVPWRTA